LSNSENVTINFEEIFDKRMIIYTLDKLFKKTLKTDNTNILSIKWQTNIVLKSDTMKHGMTYTNDTFPLNSMAGYLVPSQHCINYLSYYIKLNKI
jgi:hypothetical protein